MSKIDKEGFVITEAGEPVLGADGEKIQVTGAKRQEDVDPVIQGLKGEIKTLRETKQTLEAKGAQADEFKALLEQKETSLKNAESAAQAKVAEQIQTLTTTNTQLQTKMMTEAIRNAALAESSRFTKSKWFLREVESIGRVNEDGSVSFVIEEKNEKTGKVSERALSAKEIADHFAEENPEVVLSGGASGSGSGIIQGSGATKLSKDTMTLAEKTAFVAKHGEAEYAKIPLKSAK